MHAHILSLATSTPKHTKNQTEIPKQLQNVFQFDDHTLDKMQAIYDATEIKTRRSVVKDFVDEKLQGDFFGKNYPLEEPSTKKRNDIYIQEAPKLALQAAKKAIGIWGGDINTITHIVSVSCTGMVAPGIEFDIMQELELPYHIERYGLNFMGCFGAIKGLKMASALAKEDPKHRVLLVCTELCSLHFQKDLDLEKMISNSLFADGSAACIIGCSPQENEHSLWEIENSSAIAIPDTKEEMHWKTGHSGLEMKLTKKVPIKIRHTIREFILSLIGNYPLAKCDFPMHPGGKAILAAIKKALDLQAQDLASSYQVLQEYGNMSSPTFLFVLDELLKKSRKPKAVGVAFGPGLSLEGILLRNEKIA